MKSNLLILASVFAGIVLAQGARSAQAQSLVSSGGPVVSNGMVAAGDAPDSSAYVDGVRAVNQSRWSDAVAIFTRVADQAGQHADGALYWKAYALNKLGQTGPALESCEKLRRDHAGSSWIEDCGALEIEIHSKSGQPVQPKHQESDDLKLLALASLMQHNEKRAMAEIDEILNSNSSEKLKQGALFIMGQHSSDTAYPQIARISFMQGDVRIMRGEAKARRKEVTWEQATTDLPLESGFSLVTGSDGRAEIELENASAVYLGENSVLIFNDLHTTAGVPYTELALLSGMATLHVRPYVAGEVFILHTPTDNLDTRYPNAANLRINSYADGIAVTPAGAEAAVGVLGSKSVAVNPGQTRYFKAGRPVMDAGPISPPDFSAWDNWVANRFAERSAAMSAIAKAAGLSAPIPGLADLQGKGKFFSCEPYGTCWEPTMPLEQTSDASRRELPPDQASALVSDAVSTQTNRSGSTARNIQFIGTPSSTGAPRQSAVDPFFPCMPGLSEPTSTQPNGKKMSSMMFYTAPPWAWTECHAGGWIYRGNHYVWAVGRRHHHPPVHWVQYGHQLAFVPIHPRDVKDRPPVNLKSAVFAADSKEGAFNKIESPTAYPIAILKEPPKAFREMPMPALAKAGEPHMTSHQIRDLAVAGGMPAKSSGTPITFDLKSHNFMIAQQEVRGSHSVTVNAPITNHSGNLQSHAVGFSGGAGGSHGGSSGTGSHGSGGSGSAAGGGGSSSSSASSSNSTAGASTSSSGNSAPHK